MSFAAGSTIDVLEKQEEWWRGKLKDGTTGWFPKSYVVEEKLEPKKAAKRAAPKPPGGKSAPPAAPAAMPPTPEQQAPAAVKFTAAYDFQGQETTDLSFSAGDPILVTKQEGEWWEGKTQDGRIGIFPASFVDPIEPDESSVCIFLSKKKM